MKLACIIVASVLLSACASVHKPEARYSTLGVASIEECTRYEGREDHVVEECIFIDTDAFSGWKEIFDGLGNIAVKIMRFGF